MLLIPPDCYTVASGRVERIFRCDSIGGHFAPCVTARTFAYRDQNYYFQTLARFLIFSFSLTLDFPLHTSNYACTAFSLTLLLVNRYCICWTKRRANAQKTLFEGNFGILWGERLRAFLCKRSNKFLLFSITLSLFLLFSNNCFCNLFLYFLFYTLSRLQRYFYWAFHWILAMVNEIHNADMWLLGIDLLFFLCFVSNK